MARLALVRAIRRGACQLLRAAETLTHSNVGFVSAVALRGGSSGTSLSLVDRGQSRPGLQGEETGPHSMSGDDFLDWVERLMSDPTARLVSSLLSGGESSGSTSGAVAEPLSTRRALEAARAQTMACARHVTSGADVLSCDAAATPPPLLRDKSTQHVLGPLSKRLAAGAAVAVELMTAEAAAGVGSGEHAGSQEAAYLYHRLLADTLRAAGNQPGDRIVHGRMMELLVMQAEVLPSDSSPTAIEEVAVQHLQQLLTSTPPHTLTSLEACDHQLLAAWRITRLHTDTGAGGGSCGSGSSGNGSGMCRALLEAEARSTVAEAHASLRMEHMEQLAAGGKTTMAAQVPGVRSPAPLQKQILHSYAASGETMMDAAASQHCGAEAGDGFQWYSSSAIGDSDEGICGLLFTHSDAPVAPPSPRLLPPLLQLSFGGSGIVASSGKDSDDAAGAAASAPPLPPCYVYPDALFRSSGQPGYVPVMARVIAAAQQALTSAAALELDAAFEFHASLALWLLSDAEKEAGLKSTTEVTPAYTAMKQQLSAPLSVPRDTCILSRQAMRQLASIRSALSLAEETLNLVAGRRQRENAPVLPPLTSHQQTAGALSTLRRAIIDSSTPDVGLEARFDHASYRRLEEAAGRRANWGGSAPAAGASIDSFSSHSVPLRQQSQFTASASASGAAGRRRFAPAAGATDANGSGVVNSSGGGVSKAMSAFGAEVGARTGAIGAATAKGPLLPAPASSSSSSGGKKVIVPGPKANSAGRGASTSSGSCSGAVSSSDVAGGSKQASATAARAGVSRFIVRKRTRGEADAVQQQDGSDDGIELDDDAVTVDVTATRDGKTTSNTAAAVPHTLFSGGKPEFFTTQLFSAAASTLTAPASGSCPDGGFESAVSSRNSVSGGSTASSSVSQASMLLGYDISSPNKGGATTGKRPAGSAPSSSHDGLPSDSTAPAFRLVSLFTPAPAKPSELQVASLAASLAAAFVATPPIASVAARDASSLEFEAGSGTVIPALRFTAAISASAPATASDISAGTGPRSSKLDVIAAGETKMSPVAPTASDAAAVDDDLATSAVAAAALTASMQRLKQALSPPRRTIDANAAAAAASAAGYSQSPVTSTSFPSAPATPARIMRTYGKNGSPARAAATGCSAAGSARDSAAVDSHMTAAGLLSRHGVTAGSSFDGSFRPVSPASPEQVAQIEAAAASGGCEISRWQSGVAGAATARGSDELQQPMMSAASDYALSSDVTGDDAIDTSAIHSGSVSAASSTGTIEYTAVRQETRRYLSSRNFNAAADDEDDGAVEGNVDDDAAGGESADGSGAEATPEGLAAEASAASDSGGAPVQDNDAVSTDDSQFEQPVVHRSRADVIADTEEWDGSDASQLSKAGASNDAAPAAATQAAELTSTAGGVDDEDDDDDGSSSTESAATPKGLVSEQWIARMSYMKDDLDAERGKYHRHSGRSATDNERRSDITELSGGRESDDIGSGQLATDGGVCPEEEEEAVAEADEESVMSGVPSLPLSGGGDEEDDGEADVSFTGSVGTAKPGDPVSAHSSPSKPAAEAGDDVRRPAAAYDVSAADVHPGRSLISAFSAIATSAIDVTSAEDEEEALTTVRETANITPPPPPSHTRNNGRDASYSVQAAARTADDELDLDSCETDSYGGSPRRENEQSAETRFVGEESQEEVGAEDDAEVESADDEEDLEERDESDEEEEDEEEEADADWNDLDAEEDEGEEEDEGDDEEEDEDDGDDEDDEEADGYDGSSSNSYSPAALLKGMKQTLQCGGEGAPDVLRFTLPVVSVDSVSLSALTSAATGVGSGPVVRGDERQAVEMFGDLLSLELQVTKNELIAAATSSSEGVEVADAILLAAKQAYQVQAQAQADMDRAKQQLALHDASRTPAGKTAVEVLSGSGEDSTAAAATAATAEPAHDAMSPTTGKASASAALSHQQAGYTVTDAVNPLRLLWEYERARVMAAADVRRQELRRVLKEERARAREERRRIASGEAKPPRPGQLQWRNPYALPQLPQDWSPSAPPSSSSSSTLQSVVPRAAKAITAVSNTPAAGKATAAAAVASHGAHRRDIADAAVWREDLAGCTLGDAQAMKSRYNMLCVLSMTAREKLKLPLKARGKIIAEARRGAVGSLK